MLLLTPDHTIFGAFDSLAPASSIFGLPCGSLASPRIRSACPAVASAKAGETVI